MAGSDSAMAGRRPLAPVQVFYAKISALTDKQLRALTDFLNAEERSRSKRFVFAKDRAQFVAAHALLRSRLVTATGARRLEFQTDRYGKPALNPSLGDPPMRFNLSHTNGLVTCIIASGHTVGIDAEEVVPRQGIEEIARWAFTEAEQRIVAAKSGDERLEAFYRLWTLKEALAKGIGRGISLNLQDIDFSLEPLSLRLAARTGEDASSWRVQEFAPSRKHRVAVAVKVPPADVVTVTFRSIAPTDLTAIRSCT